MLLLSGTGIADESVGPWILTISTNDGGPAANNIDIELTVVLDEGKKIPLILLCADIPSLLLYGVSQAIRMSCDYPCSLLFVFSEKKGLSL